MSSDTKVLYCGARDLPSSVTSGFEINIVKKPSVRQAIQEVQARSNEYLGYIVGEETVKYGKSTELHRLAHERENLISPYVDQSLPTRITREIGKIDNKMRSCCDETGGIRLISLLEEIGEVGIKPIVFYSDHYRPAFESNPERNITLIRDFANIASWLQNLDILSK